MFDWIKNAAPRTLRTTYKIEERQDEIKMLQGKILASINATKPSTNLKDHEFKVFSQWGEDGILQKLIRSVDIKHNTFIEFGVEDFYESNCRFLMMNDNWEGFVIDGSQSSINRLRRSYFYWRYRLNSMCAFINRDNINEFLGASGFDDDLGVLSVDIDGVDYFVLESISAVRPRILILEYNGVFGSTRKITVPYSDHFQRTKAHYSNLYFGASLAALTQLANKKGYTLVGTTSVGVNAFFVRNDLMNDSLQAHDAQSAFMTSTPRESRDQAGNLSLLGGDDRLELLKGMPVFNIDTQQLESL